MSSIIPVERFGVSGGKGDEPLTLTFDMVNDIEVEFEDGQPWGTPGAWHEKVTAAVLWVVYNGEWNYLKIFLYNGPAFGLVVPGDEAQATAYQKVCDLLLEELRQRDWDPTEGIWAWVRILADGRQLLARKALIRHDDFRTYSDHTADEADPFEEWLNDGSHTFEFARAHQWCSPDTYKYYKGSSREDRERFYKEYLRLMDSPELLSDEQAKDLRTISHYKKLIDELHDEMARRFIR